MIVISGGQTGVDRIALEVAQELGIETGGTAAKGFETENGPDASLRDIFHLKECSSEHYPIRSQRNVDDADAVLVFRLFSSPGTDRTIGYAHTKRWCVRTISNDQGYRPVLVISSLDASEMVPVIYDFLIRHDVKVLNVAGHRASSFAHRSLLTRIKSILRESFGNYTKQQIQN